ncbi:MAG: heavy metal translocating P-type ATPase [Oscillospiraceae bacterium]|nr:heavy metal translocating P-type ATPase [Oscillospiraceae bacterium]
MEQYQVTGMSCAACSARVEKAVSGVPGVTACSVSLLTNSMGVEGTASAAEIVCAVEAAGYGARPKNAAPTNGAGGAPAWADAEALKDRETPKLKKRLLVSVPILLILMYFSMGHGMWGWPAPKAFDNHVFLGLFELLLAVLVMIINGRFFTSGFSALFHGAPNMDTLVALGSGASFGYSLVELFLMILAQGEGDHETVMKYGMNLYFESAAMIPTLITVGKLLEAKSKGRTTDALKSLMKLAPRTAILLRDGVETEVAVEQVQTGDIFAVRPGEQIPVDGVVVKGMTAVNESALTGESIPVDKTEGDAVSAATMNQQGYIECRTTRVGEDTTLAQIIRTVSDAAATKAPLARIADRVSAIFVPAVMALALLTLLGWLIAGRPFSFAIARGISVLVISCPCALGLATPVAIMVGSGVGAKNGILYKTAAALEGAGRTQILALDKTGTVTEGEPKLTDLIPIGVERNELLRLAASLEKNSEHPLAKAVSAAAEGLSLSELTGFEALPGNGLRAMLDGKTLLGGSLKYLKEQGLVTPVDEERANALAEEGKTPLLFAYDGRLIGLIAVADPIKEDSAQAIRELNGMGVRTVLLTGDNRRTARAIAGQAGVDRVIAGVLPDGKAEVIGRLKPLGKVSMVGDGINDAPALTAADNGVAIGAGADVAIDAADVVVMKSRLRDVAAAIRLSRAAIRNIHENLFWAFFYNVACIPLAMGLYGVEMKPMYGAAAMAMSSFFVCMNALRLNLVKPHDPSRDRAWKAIPAAALDAVVQAEADRPEQTVKKTLRVEGMMCVHCEARVQKALEALPGVERAVASHERGVAVVSLNAPVADETLRAAVEAEDYQVLGVE